MRFNGDCKWKILTYLFSYNKIQWNSVIAMETGGSGFDSVELEKVIKDNTVVQ